MVQQCTADFMKFWDSTKKKAEGGLGTNVPQWSPGTPGRGLGG